MWDIVWVSPQGHRSVSVSCHFLLQAPQCPCSVLKRFSRDHCCWGRSKLGCRIVGSHTRWELTTWANFQLCLQWAHTTIDEAQSRSQQSMLTVELPSTVSLWCNTLWHTRQRNKKYFVDNCSTDTNQIAALQFQCPLCSELWPTNYSFLCFDELYFALVKRH